MFLLTEKEKMLSGRLYDPHDPQLVAERRRARLLCKAINETSDDQQGERTRLLAELIPAAGHGLWIEPPFFCDYGTNITLGDKVCFNFNCVILDVAPVRIGSSVLCGTHRADLCSDSSHERERAKHGAGTGEAHGDRG